MASQAKKANLGKVLVVGGCGFLGHHVVDLLLRDYAAKVSVVDLRCTNNRRPDADGVQYFDGDITDAARLVSIFEEIKPDAVIHTASGRRRKLSAARCATRNPVAVAVNIKRDVTGRMVSSPSWPAESDDASTYVRP